MMRNVSFSRNGDFYPHNGLEKKEPLPCHAGHSFPDRIFQVNARSYRELDIVEYVLRLLDIDSFKPDHQSYEF